MRRQSSDGLDRTRHAATTQTAKTIPGATVDRDLQPLSADTIDHDDRRSLSHCDYAKRRKGEGEFVFQTNKLLSSPFSFLLFVSRRECGVTMNIGDWSKKVRSRETLLRERCRDACRSHARATLRRRSSTWRVASFGAS